MALRQVKIAHDKAEKEKLLEAARSKDAGFLVRKTALETREAELETAVNEVNEDTPQEDKDALDASIAQYEADEKALSDEEAANEIEKQTLIDTIANLERELTELNARAAKPVSTPITENRKDDKHIMENRTKFYGMNIEQRDKFFARSEVKTFIDEIRAIKTRGVTNGGLGIPDVILETLRDNLEQYSKLARFVNVKRVPGTARQNIMGAAPEGVWMEATGALNELDMGMNQIEVDGFIVGGIIYVSDVLLEDSDIALGMEVMDQLGKAIGKGVDRAILYGTGTKTPVGIVTRLAQTSAPSNWGTYAPTWTDLHSSHVLKLNIDGNSGAAFYAALVAALGVAKPNYTDGGCFWVMNRKTHINLMTKVLAFDASAALVSKFNIMPIIGGEIVEMEDIVGDNEIVGGYGGAYLLAERAGAKVDTSSHVKFREMMTGFRGYARYDGKPVFGEAFVMVSFDNTEAATTSTFPADYANTELGVLGVAAAAGTASGDTVLTVTGTETEGTTLKYKIGDLSVTTGQKVTGYTALTSGTTQITCAAGKYITVVELDGNSKVIKSGKVVSVPKA